MSLARLPLPILLLLLLAPPPLPAQGMTLPDARRVELDNGVVVILSVKDDVPLVGVTAMLKGGAARDPADRAGLASLFAGLLAKGAGERDAGEFAEAIDRVGGRLETRAGLEAITVSGDFLARDTTLMLELLSDMLMRPTLDEEAFAKLKVRAINLQKAARDSDPAALMPSYANAFVFGGHPYGQPVDGSESSLAAITHDDIVDYYANSVGADRLVISIAGDFDADALEAQLAESFGGWRQATNPLAEMPEPPAAAGNRVLLVDKPGATQTYFWIGNRGVAVNYNGRAELDLVNTLFGGRFTSMLNSALRIETGLTYAARSNLLRPSQPGTVAISSYTATETTTEAIDLALDVLARFRAEGVDAPALDSAKKYVLGLFPLRLETAAQLARQFGTLEVYGLERRYVDGYADAIQSVTEASAAGVIAEVYPAPEDLVYVLLGDAETIREVAAGYGSVTELPITAPTFRPPETGETDETDE